MAYSQCDKDADEEVERIVSRPTSLIEEKINKSKHIFRRRTSKCINYLTAGVRGWTSAANSEVNLGDSSSEEACFVTKSKWKDHYSASALVEPLFLCANPSMTETSVPSSTFYSSTRVNIVQTRPVDPNCLKVAIRADPSLIYYDPTLTIPVDPTGQPRTEFLELNKQNLVLSDVIERLIQQWSLPADATNYSLLFDETQIFLTSENLADIKNGSILCLSVSTRKCSKILINNLRSADSEASQIQVLTTIAKHSRDVAFVKEFLSQDGFVLIADFVQAGTCIGGALSLLLHCFSLLMDHGLVDWDTVVEHFVVRIASYVTGRSKHEDHRTLTAALNILESIVSNSKDRVGLVQKEVLFDSLIRHLDKSDSDVQRNTLALMNALFIKAESGEKKRIVHEILTEKPVRSALEMNVLKRNSSMAGTELGHQLGVMQRLLFNFIYSRAMLKYSDTDSIEIEKLHDLRKTAFESTGDLPTSPNQIRRQHSSPQNTSGFSKEFRKLGFQTPEKPTTDLDNVPPGILALDCMLYFARQHLHIFTRIILESTLRTDGHSCPFAIVSIELVKELIEILTLGQPPRDEAESYYEMFFKKTHPFEDFFSVCLKRLYKTWSEMRATVDDVSKVIAVVHEQIVRALKQKPITFEKFHDELGKLSYSEIQNIWQQERLLREETEFQAKPIRELMEDVRPIIRDLVRTNRLNTLKRGKIFQKFGRGSRGVREKGKFWFWKLSNNNKMLHYADCDETSVPDRFEEIKQRLTVSELKDVAIGRDCPHVKETKSSRKTGIGYSFSLLHETEESFNFVANDEDTFQIWTDGLCALLGQRMPSSQATQELETLLQLEMKIRLLDLEGIPVPNSPPPVPELPPDFDFAYNN